MTSIHNSSLTRYAALYQKPLVHADAPKKLDPVKPVSPVPQQTATSTQQPYVPVEPLEDDEWRQYADSSRSLKAISHYRNTHNQFAKIEVGDRLAGIDVYA